MNDVSLNFNGTRRGRVSFARAMECMYQCLHCPRPRWTTGGAASLGRHLASHHGIPFSPFPAYVCIDDQGYVVDHEGVRVLVRRKPQRPVVDGLDGLLKSVELRTREVAA